MARGCQGALSCRTDPASSEDISQRDKPPGFLAGNGILGTERDSPSPASGSPGAGAGRHCRIARGPQRTFEKALGHKALLSPIFSFPIFPRQRRCWKCQKPSLRSRSGLLSSANQPELLSLAVPWLSEGARGGRSRQGWPWAPCCLRTAFWRARGEGGKTIAYSLSFLEQTTRCHERPFLQARWLRLSSSRPCLAPGRWDGASQGWVLGCLMGRSGAWG